MTMENQLKTISVQGLLKLRNCADRLIAQKLRNERAIVREQLSGERSSMLGQMVSQER
jgi:hypothetical protein